MIVGDGTFELQGTAAQQAILEPCFYPPEPEYIAFPWERLAARPAQPIPIGWMNLNELAAEMNAAGVHKRSGHLEPTQIPGHVHTEDADGNEGHGILRRTAEGRWFVAGVFWTDGRIYLDTRCEAEPELAREVMSAELAHSVDYFLPLTDEQKTALAALVHEHPDAHTWWETHDYGAEYYDLVGETFMAMFTVAYAPGITPWQDAFTHKVIVEQGADVRAILGVELDGAAPEPAPEPEPTPEPPPIPELPVPPEIPPLPELPPAEGPKGIAGWAAAAIAAIASVVGIVIGWFLG